MQIQQVTLDSPELMAAQMDSLAAIEPQLLLVFCSVEYLTDSSLLEQLRERFPGVPMAGCSTAGEISAAGVMEHSAVVTAVHFDGAVRIELAEGEVAHMGDSEAAGASLGQALQGDDLRAVLVFGKGLEINGSALINGINAVLGERVPVTGGLGGDNGAFAQTYAITPAGAVGDGVVAIGLYGDDLIIGQGSYGGWSPFGPARKVTRCEGTVLYELDGRPALQIYKDYLGEYAEQLPSSGLLFPFEMLDRNEAQVGLIRTILGIDEAEGALILAGEIDPEGFLRLMHASTENLVQGAEEAARLTLSHLPSELGNGLAILVSCVGRKLVMGEETEDEVDAVVEVLGSDCAVAGFYSYGEICPQLSTTDCKLHNQTMTVTLIGEK
jgi:hypothetical protein